MLYTKIIALSGFTLLFTGCTLFQYINNKENTYRVRDTQAEKTFTPTSDSCAYPLVVDQMVLDNTPGVFVESIAFQNPCIEVIVNYSGCSKGDITVYWDGRVAERYPPTVMLYIAVENAGDCDQILTEKITIQTDELRKYAGKKFYVRMNTFKNTIPISFLD